MSANFDNLSNMLRELIYPFTIIGLTETKFSTSKDSFDNIYLPGYRFLFQPSLSNAGRTGIFVQDHLKVSIRSDLTKSVSSFEALWIEVINYARSNLLCGVIYRHPNENINEFSNYLNFAVERISKENKPCVIMGDFNLDLLKYNSYFDTDNYLNYAFKLFST